MKRSHLRAHLGLSTLLALCMLIPVFSSVAAQEATPTEISQADIIPTETAPAETPTITPEPSPEPTDVPVETAVPSEVPADPTTTAEPTIVPEESPGPTAVPTETSERQSLSIQAVDPILVSPENPTVVQATCVGGVIIQPTVTLATTPGLTYQSSDVPTAGGVYALIAYFSDGYAWGPMPDGWTLVGDGAVAFTAIDLEDAPPCADAMPTSPTVQQATCADGTFAAPTLDLPVNTEVISYTQVGQVAVGRSVIVTAELERETDAWTTPLPAGWSLEGSFAVFPVGPFAKAACAPAEPLIVAATCSDGMSTPASITMPADTNAISYQDTGGGYFLASLRTGSVAWADPMPSGWIVVSATDALFIVDDLDVDPCDTANLASPDMFHAMYIDDYEPGDVIDLTPIVPNSPGVSYHVSGIVAPNGTITVTAELRDGYDWPDVMPLGWVEIDDDTAHHTFTISTGFDVIVSPIAPSVVQASCAAGDPEVGLPDHSGVTYTQAGDDVAGGTVTVNATLDAGYAWSGNLSPGWVEIDDATARFIVHLDEVSCEPDDAGSDGDNIPQPLGSSADDATVTGLPTTGQTGPAAEGLALPLLFLALATVLALAGTGIRRGED